VSISDAENALGGCLSAGIKSLPDHAPFVARQIFIHGRAM